MSDTIAAISTGAVISAIGIVRLSGDAAISIADKVFRASSGLRLADAKDRHMYYGEITDVDGNAIDLCMCMIAHAPNSYTGENTVEFHCHGSPVVLSEALRSLFAHGARQAEAGEFTKRAFLNGRMDLTQAEAVIDLIEAETPSAAKNAAAQLQGAVRLRLDSVYESLLEIMAHFHVVVDYPDEEVSEFEAHSYIVTLQSVLGELSQMLSTYSRGRVLINGVPTVIIGRPNTGKSSLLNALLGFERAIVTDVPGTTRDTIEEKLVIGDMLLRIIDTAGIRSTDDVAEKMGVSRSHEAISRSSLALLVFDGSMPLQKEDFDVLRCVPESVSKIIVVNKSDLPQMLGDNELLELGSDYCRVCSINGEGFDALEALIKKALPEHTATPVGELITNARQAESISRGRDSIAQAIQAIEISVTPDAVLTDVEEALGAIGEITGKNMREDIVSKIFERFCVGK